MPSSPQSPPLPPPPPAPQVYELTLPPPSSIAAASPKPSEATETEPNNHAQQEEIRSTSQGDASPTTKPEQAQVPSDHHENPSDDIEGKTARNSGDHSGDNYHGNSNSSNSSDCNRNFGTGDDPKIVYDPGGYTLNPKDDSMRDDGADTTISSDNASCSADNHNNIDRSDNAFPFPNTDVTSITDHGCSDCDHPHNPTSISNGSKCKLVYDPGGNSLNTKDGAPRDDGGVTSNNNSSGIVSRTADTHYSFDRDRDKTVFTAADVDPVLDTDAAQRPLSPQRPADSLISDHAPDIAHTPPTSQPVNSNPNAFDNTNSNTIADTAHSLDTSTSSSSNTIESDTDTDDTDAAPIPSTTARDNEPEPKYENERPRTPPPEGSTQAPPTVAPPPDKPEEPPPARPTGKATLPPTPKVVQSLTRHIADLARAPTTPRFDNFGDDRQHQR